MNINSAKNLLEKYKSLTFEQLEERFNILKIQFIRKCRGDDVMLSFTGFGACETCSLCLEAKKLVIDKEDLCEHCIYKLTATPYPYCIDTTYDEIVHATNPKELYEALQDRIKYLESTINILENER